MASNPFLLSNGDATRLTDAAAADHLPITAAEGSLQAAHAAAAAATDLAAQSAPPSSDKPSEVSAIIRGANGRSILIGGRLARENDVVDDRWRIVAIRSDGVVVENIATPPQP